MPGIQIVLHNSLNFPFACDMGGWLTFTPRWASFRAILWVFQTCSINTNASGQLALVGPKVDLACTGPTVETRLMSQLPTTILPQVRLGRPPQPLTLLNHRTCMCAGHVPQLSSSRDEPLLEPDQSNHLQPLKDLSLADDKLFKVWRQTCPDWCSAGALWFQVFYSFLFIGISFQVK